MLWATAAIVVIVLVVAGLDGGLRRATAPAVLHRWSSSATTVASRPWRLVTSIPLTSGPRMTAAMCLAVVVMFGVAEWRLGWRRAAIVGMSASVVATIACDAALLAGAALGVAGAHAAAHAADFGISAVTSGTAGLVARTLPLRAAVVVGVVVLNGIVVHHQLADWEHVVAFGFGAAMAPVPR